jgi:predicted dehydrogenase
VAVHLHQDYLQRPASRGCEVIGDRGKAAMDLRSLTFTHYDAEGQCAASESFEGFDRNRLFLDETGHFLDCVATRRKPIVDLRDGIWSLRMALAAKQSMATRGVVEVAGDEHASSIA